jgi:tripartite-type tricarboxylate transporter receptor subunit TctC
MIRYIRTAVATASLLSLSVPAIAQDAAVSFAGKEINLIIGYGVGGGYDAYARLLAPHMTAHLAGNPTILPQNMPGAGSLKAANYIFSVAAKDGTAMGTFAQQIAVAPLLGDAKFDSREFGWIGSIASEVSICITSSKSQIASWDDMLTKPHVFGGEGRGSDLDTLTIAMQTLFGTKTRIVTGYPGTSELLLAVERGEIDGLCGMSYSSLKSRFKTLLDDKKIRIILQAGVHGAPDLTVPNLLDLAATPEQKQLMGFILAPNAMGRPYAAPPGLPKEVLATLRAAFDATMKDPAFLSDAARLKLDVSPISGAEIEAAIDQLYATPKDIVEKVAEISGAKK